MDDTRTSIVRLGVERGCVRGRLTFFRSVVRDMGGARGGEGAAGDHRGTRNSQERPIYVGEELISTTSSTSPPCNRKAQLFTSTFFPSKSMPFNFNTSHLVTKKHEIYRGDDLPHRNTSSAPQNYALNQVA